MRRSVWMTGALLSLATLATAILLAGGPSARSQGPTRPNVVVVMTDDQTVESMRVMPRVRSLIGAQGTTFTNSFVNYALCCPSRATYITGQYAHNNGVERGNDYELLDTSTTLPVWLEEDGYRTAHIGKYVNGYGFQDRTDVPPGWTEWYGALPDEIASYDYDLNENGTVVHYGSAPADFKGDVITDLALDFIGRRAPAPDPFFLSVAYTAPHVGGPGAPCPNAAKPPPRDVGDFATEPLPQGPAFNEADVSDKPFEVRSRPVLGPASVTAVTARYRCALESLQHVDDAVASMVAALGGAGELDSTLFIFTSDNGVYNGEHRIPGGKIWPYEEALRVPLLMRGPGTVAGAKERSFATNADLAPTIADAAGVTPALTVDGESLFELTSGSAPDRDLLLEARLEGNLFLTGFDGLRTRRYLYTEYTTGERELYDLRVDPDELTNRVTDPAYGPTVRWLARRLEELRTCSGDHCREPAGAPPVPLGGSSSGRSSFSGSASSATGAAGATGGVVSPFAGGPSFAAPSALAISPQNGHLYVADTSANRVAELTVGGDLVRTWGRRGSDAAEFIAPRAIAVAPNGDVYVADSSNGRIQQFDGDGQYIREWDGSGSPAGAFDAPEGIAVGATGDVYVADGGNDRVAAFTAAGAFVRELGGSGTGTRALDSPGAVATAPGGDVYVADRGNDRIVEFDAAGAFVREWGSFGSADGELSYPRGITVGPTGDVYVADTANSRVEQFQADGTFVRRWGARGSGPGHLFNPRGVAVAAGGDIFVADSLNDRLQRFSSTGSFVEEWGPSSSQGRFRGPRGIAVDPSGRIYVADTQNSRIQQLRTNGTFVRSWGSNGAGPGQFEYPDAVAVGPTGAVYVSDTQNQRVQKFTAAGVYVSDWGRRGSGPGEFDTPRGVAVGPTGAVYVADADNDRVQQFTPDGSFVRQWGGTGSAPGRFRSPNAIAVGPSGDVYVSDRLNSRIQQFTAQGAFVRAWGSQGSGRAQLDGQNGIAVASNGDVYVADGRNDRVQQYAANGRYIDTTTSPLLDAPVGIAASNRLGEAYVTSGVAAIQRVLDRTPNLTGTAPVSPAPDTTPLVKGKADPMAVVELFATTDCSGSPIGVGHGTDLASPGIEATVPAGQTTHIRATAADADGNWTSGCSSPLTYVEN